MNANKKEESNLVFIDGQNLYMGIRSDNPSWAVDLAKFREYLSKKYHAQKAYYYLGCVDEKYQDLGFNN